MPRAQPTKATQPTPYCICAPVSQRALDAILEQSGAGAYKDTHPWHLAQELLEAARQSGQALPLLLAAGEPLAFSWWAEILDIHIVAFRRGTWETRCEFSTLSPVHAIFQPLDSIALYPGAEQRRREALEPIAPHRQFLDARLLHPYAICETPAFIGAPPSQASGDAPPSAGTADALGSA